LTKSTHFTILRPSDVLLRWINKMAKTKTAIKMISTEGTGTFYVTKKNPKNNAKKLELSKYDPKLRKHVKFKEGKIK